VEHPTVLGRGWALLALVAYPVMVVVMRPRSRRRVALTGAFLLYLTAVIAVTIFPIHVVPPAWRLSERWWDTVRLIPLMVPPGGFALNIVMFMPFGVLLPLLWPRTGTIRQVFWWSLATSAVIELSQLTMWITLGNRRFADVNDLYSNSIGGVLGFVLFRTLMPARTLKARSLKKG
jgi:glycopeptide antibiotics resistance protein